MDRIQIISYRPNHDDYCRGCPMDSTDSEFAMEDIQVPDPVKVAVDLLAAFLFSAKKEESNRAYGCRETFVVVNGVREDAYLDDEDDAASFASRETALRIRAEATQLCEVNLAASKKALEEAKAKEWAIRAEEERQRDLKQLEDLKKKLGVE